MNNIFNYVSCGVYIVTSKNAGCVINTLTQINSKDPLVSISINKDNYTNEVIKKSNQFVVSVLSVDASMDMISEFGFKSSKDYDKFLNVKYTEADGNKVVLENAIGYILCDLKEIIDCGTHDLFIGIVREQKVLNEFVPMTYDYYKTIKKGSTPPKAPSFIKRSEEIVDDNNKQYQCIICGHIYDDSEEDIKFEDLPDNWVCPKCRVGKDKFKRIK